MPKQGLRYAAKVDLKKEAASLPYLHVISSLMSHPGVRRPLTV